MEISYRLDYDCRNDDRDTVRSFNMNFENPSNEDLVDNLNTWLTAIKVPLEVVLKKPPILVLNASYEPLNFTNWRRAVVLLIKNKAQALGKRVIRLVNYIKIPYKKLMQNKPSRAMIYKRDGHKCQYCGSTRNLTIDHIFPTSKGGDNSWENLVVACMPCNTRKGDKLLEETNLILETTPKKPFNKMLFSLDRADVQEWKKYSYN